LAKSQTSKSRKSGPSVVLVGAETLLGRELIEVLESRLPGISLEHFAASAEGNFGEGEMEGEAVYLQPVTPEALAGVDAVLLAGTADGANKTYDIAKSAKSPALIIDFAGYLEAKPEARLVPPLIGDTQWAKRDVIVLAQPAASVLGLTLLRASKNAEIRRAVVHVFAPASEHGKRGITELHQQTTSLLAFRTLDKNVFDAQLSFNLLPQYGEDAPEQLAPIENRIERHVASILNASKNGLPIPMPSIRLVQAPVFHGHSISCWFEFVSAVDPVVLGEALASAQIDVRGSEHEPPSNVGAAGQSGLTVGDIRVDPNNAHAAWLWAVADNVRILADACADILAQPGITVQ
jgi:aspartate-semialdehyde dehydrogenase